MNIYTDINLYYESLEDTTFIITDEDAVLAGFLNILNTLKDADNIGERPFRPNIGSSLQRLLQDPLDAITAFQIKLALADIAKQANRCTFDFENTTITANLLAQCFDVRLVLINGFNGKIITSFLSLSRG
jgi:phage baseplate assembly protein W